ncbi:protein EPIDERMAL PATTERNING FACTOR 1-like [Trifolium pratense]|uniref:protein EPIDERMAL PATTERNING FACTOR 1-like n=1 Tax=Trifolium pratense TaxID=57577 RepID=UPI001E696287|nr:protein EPIDERMAL PATTERNING FACTOR 1-like [Trifolium pratense]XP_045806090.1 protein EPIDERMAL PATTERNING FACTOR 1-like [Trifolium pratense]
MKRNLVYVSAFVLVLLFVPMLTSSRHISYSNLVGHGHSNPEVGKKVDATKGAKQNPYSEGRTKHMRRPDTMQVAGSRLPDCSHACGSCTPCRLVMVSLVCASLAEAESCPMAYKCMCHNKSYPVP